MRLQAAGTVAAAPATPAASAGRPHREHRHHDRDEDRRDEERGMDFSPEETDGDAVAAETGALG